MGEVDPYNGDNDSLYPSGATQEFHYDDPGLSVNGTNANEAWTAGYGEDQQGVATWNPQSFSKHVDRETGYWYYENVVTGERHWDRPLEGVVSVRPKSPSTEEKLVDDARQERQQLEREMRQKDMALRRAYFDRLLLEEGESAEAKERRRVQAVWDEAEQHAGRKGGDFSVAWLQVPGVSEKHLFGFHERHGGMRIVNLRLVGLGLTEVPDAIGTHLWSLKSLSLSSNALQEIPDGMCDLTALTELNLVRNKLASLPDRFGNLLKLRNLSLAGNRLETIPPSFGNLLHLDRVVLDCNSLRRLPETLGRMKCHWLNVSNNKLAGLPHCLKDMPRLTKISVVNNGLRTLPSDIGDSRSLTALHVASNRLNELPDSICRLKTLKVLWLDHNRIAGLPMKFHELVGLERLMLEHNDMMYPPSSVVLQGCDHVRRWCYRRMHDRVMARQHTIVMAVQDILKQITARGLGDPSYFEPDVRLETNTGDNFFYALVYERFWDTMLPALEREWQTGPPAPRGAITSFGYAREEVDSVLVNYKDPTGRVLRTKTQMFRRCACMGANGRRRVCVPPRAGWMCERKATLIKHDIILEREQEERRRQAMEREDIEFRVGLARRLVKESSETIEGKKTYMRKAIRMAEELRKKKQMGEFQSEAEAMKAHRRQAVEKKFAKTKQSIMKEREHRLADLKLKVGHLQEELTTLRGWGKEQKEAQIDQVLASMAALPEDKKLAEVEQQLEEEVERLEQKAAAAEKQKARKVMSKKVNRADKEFQELVDEMMADLVLQDMDAAGEAARRKAEEEHEVFRRIVALWVGLGMRESFAEWKMWTKKRIKQRRKDARKALREAWHDYEAEGVVSVMAEWKMSFWQEEYDAFNDTQFWRHKETGEVRTDCPTVAAFIPEGYTMPKPPSKRLEDMSSSSSSGSGSSNSGESGDTEGTAPRVKGGGRSGSTSSSGSGESKSSGWSFASSSSDDEDDDDDDDGDGDETSSDGTGKGSAASAASPSASAAPSSAGGSDGGSGSRESSDGSAESRSASSSSESGSETSAGSESDDENSGGSGSSGSSSSSSAPLQIEDGNNNDATTSSSRATTKRTSSDEKTTSTTLATVDDTNTDSAQALALQITSGGENDGEEGGGDHQRSLVPAGGADNSQPSGTAASSSRDGVVVAGGDRGESVEVDKRRRKKGRPKSKAVAIFIKDKAVELYKDAEKLIQASDGSSSAPSSLRTEKSLERQRGWEIDHARVRARKLREKWLKDVQQEEKIRREMAAIKARALESREAAKPKLDEVMTMVGWDPERDYTNKEVEAFAKKAMKTMKELGRERELELKEFAAESI